MSGRNLKNLYVNGIYDIPNIPCNETGVVLNSCATACLSTVQLTFNENSLTMVQTPRVALPFECACSTFTYTYSLFPEGYTYIDPQKTFVNLISAETRGLLFTELYLFPPALCIGAIFPASTSLPSSTTTSFLSNPTGTPGGNIKDTSKTSSKASSIGSGAIAGIVVGCLLFFALLFLAIFCYKKRNRKTKSNLPIIQETIQQPQKQTYMQNQQPYLSHPSPLTPPAFAEIHHMNRPTSVLSSPSNVSAQYRGIVQHYPNLEDEIEVSPGDLIFISEIYQDSWANGYNSRTGFTGKVPMTALEVVYMPVSSVPVSSVAQSETYSVPIITSVSSGATLTSAGGHVIPMN